MFVFRPRRPAGRLGTFLYAFIVLGALSSLLASVIYQSLVDRAGRPTAAYVVDGDRDGIGDTDRIVVVDCAGRTRELHFGRGRVSAATVGVTTDGGAAIVVGVADGQKGHQGTIQRLARSGIPIWEAPFDLYDPDVLRAVIAHGGSHSAFLEVVGVWTLRFRGRGVVLAAASDPRWSVSRIVALGLETGEYLGGFYHWGRVDPGGRLADLDGDGEAELVLTGLSDYLWWPWVTVSTAWPTLMVVEIEEIVGLRRAQTWPPGPPSLRLFTPRVFQLFPNVGAHRGYIVSVDVADIERDGRTDIVTHTDDGRSYSFSATSGSYQGVRIGPRWRELEGQRAPPDPFSPTAAQLAIASALQLRDIEAAARYLNNAARLTPAESLQHQEWQQRFDVLRERFGDPGLLGVIVDVRAQGPVEIVGVIPGTPADSARLRVGDLVHSVNGEGVRSAYDLMYRALVREPGEATSLGISRRGRRHEVDVLTGSWRDLDRGLLQRARRAGGPVLSGADSGVASEGRSG